MLGKFNKAFYTIPFMGQTVIYKPLRRLAFVGNTALIRYLERREEISGPERNPKIERFLRAISFDAPDIKCHENKLDQDTLQPSSAVLLMTNKCNLRCLYCYANAGAESQTVEMDWPTAQTAIDHVLTIARKTDAEPPELTFHGGGEPTVHWDLLTRAVTYAKSQDSRTRVSMSSNGVWTKVQREFICKHFDSVSLSMDGTAAPQNHQRPRTNGSESFNAVWASIEAIENADVDYGIRMTVLPESVNILPESVSFVCQNTTAKAIQIEPSFTSSRGHYADIGCDFADAFSKRFMEAWRIGHSAGRMVYYSGARPWVIASMFCQAPLKATIVTADGRLVTCFEVFSEKSPMAAGFTIGRIRDNRVVYDQPALQKFLAEQQKRRQSCIDCFCYWHCCGDCATRRYGELSESKGRCRATQNITLALLSAYMEEGKGVWQGLGHTVNETS